MITNVAAVTVFNGRTDKTTRRKIYIPTVIRGVSCVEAKGATVANNGVWSDDVQYKIRIPVTADFQNHRLYLPEREYGTLDNVEAEKYWTIQKEDTLVLSEYQEKASLLYEDEISEYVRTHGLELIRIKEYADDTYGGSLYLKHWRIGGK